MVDVDEGALQDIGQQIGALLIDWMADNLEIDAIFSDEEIRNHIEMRSEDFITEDVVSRCGFKPNDLFDDVDLGDWADEEGLVSVERIVDAIREQFGGR